MVRHNRGGTASGQRRTAAVLLCVTSLLAARASAAVSGSSDNWHVELLGTSRECDACEPRFELRATGPDREMHEFDLPADGATAVNAIHVWGNRAVIVQSFAGRSLYRVVFYALSGQRYTGAWSGFPGADVLGAEFSMSPDSRYVLFRPARALGEPMTRGCCCGIP